jgi:hypothetical protein
VPLTEQGDQQQLGHVALADDHSVDVVDDLFAERGDLAGG